MKGLKLLGTIVIAIAAGFFAGCVAHAQLEVGDYP